MFRGNRICGFCIFRKARAEWRTYTPPAVSSAGRYGIDGTDDDILGWDPDVAAELIARQQQQLQMQMQGGGGMGWGQQQQGFDPMMQQQQGFDPMMMQQQGFGGDQMMPQPGMPQMPPGGGMPGGGMPGGGMPGGGMPQMPPGM